MLSPLASLTTSAPPLAAKTESSRLAQEYWARIEGIEPTATATAVSVRTRRREEQRCEELGFEATATATAETVMRRTKKLKKSNDYRKRAGAGEDIYTKQCYKKRDRGKIM